MPGWHRRKCPTGGPAWSAWAPRSKDPGGCGRHGEECISWGRSSALNMNVPETDMCVQHDSTCERGAQASWPVPGRQPRWPGPLCWGRKRAGQSRAEDPWARPSGSELAGLVGCAARSTLTWALASPPGITGVSSEVPPAVTSRGSPVGPGSWRALPGSPADKLCPTDAAPCTASQGCKLQGVEGSGGGGSPTKAWNVPKARVQALGTLP